MWPEGASTICFVSQLQSRCRLNAIRTIALCSSHTKLATTCSARISLSYPVQLELTVRQDTTLRHSHSYVRLVCGTLFSTDRSSQPISNATYIVSAKSRSLRGIASVRHAASVVGTASPQRHVWQVILAVAVAGRNHVRVLELWRADGCRGGAGAEDEGEREDREEGGEVTVNTRERADRFNCSFRILLQLPSYGAGPTITSGDECGVEGYTGLQAGVCAWHRHTPAACIHRFTGSQDQEATRSNVSNDLRMSGCQQERGGHFRRSFRLFFRASTSASPTSFVLWHLLLLMPVRCVQDNWPAPFIHRYLALPYRTVSIVSASTIG
jgi:hypothetical protein